MEEICMSGSMSGERKRSVAAWPKQPRLSSTLPVTAQHEPVAQIKDSAETDGQESAKTRHRPVSFDHLVGGGEQQGWHREAQCFGGFEGDHQIELLWPLYR